MTRVSRPPGSQRRKSPEQQRASTVQLRQSEERYRMLVEGVRDYAILMLDTNGVVQSWNAGVEAISGYTADQVIGQHFSVFYPPEAVAKSWPAHELKVARQTGRFEDEGWRMRRDGSRYWANVVITALRDDEGEVIGFSKIVRDLSDRREQEEMLRESEERFRLLVDGVKDYAIFMLTPEGYIASWNAGAQAMKGYDASEIIGQHFSIFYPPDANARHWPEHELKMARSTGRFEDEGFRVRKDGSRFWANVVITALYDHRGELRGFGKVTRDLTVRKQIEELQRTERRMNEFLAMLGHELRNPLSPLQSALDILDMKPNDPAAVDWTRKVFGRQVRHLSRLVDDLLDVSRITSGKVALRFENVDLAGLVQETVDGMRPQIEARRHNLKIELPAAPLLVRGDPTRLAQIVTNLVANASKYTPDGGDIRVTLEHEDPFATLTVADTGIGLAPALIPQMFDLFVQGDRALDRKEGGLGIGLTLVKHLTELHGGTVAAASPGLRQGSQFVVRLPVLADQSNAPFGAPTPAVAAERFKVLIVEDNADVARSLAMLVEMLGHRVELVNDGNLAVAAALAFVPDLVLLDIGLPGMNGYEVARAMRAERTLRNAVLVACTGYGQEDDRRRVQEAGFDRYLIKPLHVGDLEQILAAMAGRRAAERGASGD
ncbi:MAG TPA: PAS domain S-box protein [Casimicrobiaceae bacterium]|jgi:PAS domain S-box-containing protein|nr:PAS domain S-box protein [Casimicrobiaceae bacterium]